MGYHRKKNEKSSDTLRTIKHPRSSRVSLGHLCSTCVQPVFTCWYIWYLLHLVATCHLRPTLRWSSSDCRARCQAKAKASLNCSAKLKRRPHSARSDVDTMSIRCLYDVYTMCICYALLFAFIKFHQCINTRLKSKAAPLLKEQGDVLRRRANHQDQGKWDSSSSEHAELWQHIQTVIEFQTVQSYTASGFIFP
jgi:hypothetical protein